MTTKAALHHDRPDAFEGFKAADRDQEHERGAREQQHDHGGTRSLDDRLVAVGVGDEDAGCGAAQRMEWTSSI